MRRTTLKVGVLLALGASRSPGQAPTVRTLGAPEATYSVEVSRVTGIREFPDGRAILLDSREIAVHLLDPQDGSAVTIGRRGAGPGEYARPSGLVSLPGDTILVADPGNNRYLVLGPQGRTLGTMDQVAIHPDPQTRYVVTVGGTDGQGRLYFALPRGLIAEGDSSTPLLRSTRANGRIDTVGRLFTAATSMPVRATGAALGMMRTAPFPERDEWVVAADGAIAIVRTAPYRIEWILPTGRTVAGPRIPFDPVAVDEREKEAWRLDARSRAGTLTTTSADGRTTQQRVPVPEPDEWPRDKPPFVGPVAIAHDGRVWVERSRATRDTIRSYDVFGRDGRLEERVRMSERRRVVGFGRQVMYVAVSDEDDLIRIERHRVRP